MSSHNLMCLKLVLIIVFVSSITMQELPNSLLTQLQNIKSKVDAVSRIGSNSDPNATESETPLANLAPINKKDESVTTELPKTVTEVVSEDGVTRRIIHLTGDSNQEVQVVGDHSNATMRRTPNSISVEAHNIL